MREVQRQLRKLQTRANLVREKLVIVCIELSFILVKSKSILCIVFLVLRSYFNISYDSDEKY